MIFAGNRAVRLGDRFEVFRDVPVRDGRFYVLSLSR